jgi:hypothetical protein
LKKAEKTRVLGGAGVTNGPDSVMKLRKNRFYLPATLTFSALAILAITVFFISGKIITDNDSMRTVNTDLPKEPVAKKPAAVEETYTPKPLIRQPASAKTPQKKSAITTMPAATSVPYGIMYDGAGSDDSFALINNSIVSRGESVEGAMVVNIDRDSVSLLYEGSEINLRLSR